MCWMQFDDVMDDMQDDIREDRKTADELEKKIKKYGLEKPDAPQKFTGQKFTDGNYMQEAYGSKNAEWLEWIEYIKKLRKIIEDYEQKKK